MLVYKDFEDLESFYTIKFRKHITNYRYNYLNDERYFLRIYVRKI